MKKPGFTLIESIAAVMVMTIIFFVFAAYISAGFESWRFIGGQKGMVLEARAALNRLMREFKLINGSANITVFTTTEVRFKDVDNLTVDISQEGSYLCRGNGISNDSLLDHLQSPGGLVLTYLDTNEAVTNIRDNIAVIRIKITTIKGENRVVLQSAARLRVKTI